MRARPSILAVLVALLALVPPGLQAQTGPGAKLLIAQTIVDFMAELENVSHGEDALYFLYRLIHLVNDEPALARGVTPKAAPVEGALVPIPGATPTGCAVSKSAAIHPNGRFIYLATDAGAFGNVCAFAYDAAASTLTPIPGTPFRAGIGTRSVTIDPAGEFVYAANPDDGTLSGFAVDATTGTLTPLAGSPYAAGRGTRNVVADPSGRFVYATNQLANNISGYAINRDTGALTPLPGSPYAAGVQPRNLAIDPRGKYLYVDESTQVLAFAINAATGALAPIGAGFGSDSSAMAVDPSGRYLYVASDEPSSVLTPYRIQADGTITPAGPGVTTGANPISVAAAKNGRFVYTANGNAASVSGFRIDDATGTLTPIEGSPFPAGENVSHIATAGALAANATWPAGEAFVRPLGVSGGRPPYAWAITAGSMPPGVTFQSDIGAIMGAPTTPGEYAFTAQVSDSAANVATAGYTFKVTGNVSLPAFATVVEYYHASLDHYFITWLAAEIAVLDAGTVIKGWTRTGKSFNGYVSAQPGSSAICRYYIPPALGDSHFFGRGTAECAATGAANPSFVLEDPSFMRMILPTAGVCPANTTPVYRVFSNRPDANHRYMTERTVRDGMVAQGWLAEGDGPDLVVMCAPGS